MIEIDGLWFFVHLFNFLTILVLLNFLLFRPILKLLRERSERISGTLEEARQLQKRSEEAMAELNREIGAAKEKARNIFLQFQKEGFNEQRKILEKAREKSVEIIEKAKLELRDDADKARTLLREESSRLSLEIARKVLGREIYR
jgi:F-type H+-transporting ATPase subunit b